MKILPQAKIKLPNRKNEPILKYQNMFACRFRGLTKSTLWNTLKQNETLFRGKRNTVAYNLYKIKNKDTRRRNEK